MKHRLLIMIVAGLSVSLGITVLVLRNEPLSVEVEATVQQPSDLGCLSFSPYEGFARFNVGYPEGSVEFDENGTIYYPTEDGPRYHFSLISRWGISALIEYCQSGSSPALASARAQASYLADRMTRIEGADAYTLIWPIPGGGAEAGTWASAISNSATADLLVHLGAITDDLQLVESGIGIARSFTLPVSEGGMLWAMERGGHFFEEYASVDAPTKHVLNGHILAMQHIHTVINNLASLGRSEPDLEASFEGAIQVFYEYMDDFDVVTRMYGKTTHYDISTFATKAAYEYPHRIHWSGAQWLGEILDNQRFLRKAADWRQIYIDACQEAQKTTCRY